MSEAVSSERSWSVWEHFNYHMKCNCYKEFKLSDSLHLFFFLPFFIVLVISYYIFIQQIGKVSFIINVKTSLKLEPWKECEWRALELLEYLCIAVTLQEKEMTQWNGTELLEAVQKDKLKGAEAQ